LKRFDLVKKALGDSAAELELSEVIARCGKQVNFHLGRATPKTLVKVCQAIAQQFREKFEAAPDSYAFLRQVGALTLEDAFRKELEKEV